EWKRCFRAPLPRHAAGWFDTCGKLTKTFDQDCVSVPFYEADVGSRTHIFSGTTNRLTSHRREDATFDPCPFQNSQDCPTSCRGPLLQSSRLPGARNGTRCAIGPGRDRPLPERARDQNELAYDMNQDLARESQEIDHSAATFGRLRACRFGQAQFVKNQARAGVLDRPTALARIAYHRDKFNEELNIAHEF